MLGIAALALSPAFSAIGSTPKAKNSERQLSFTSSGGFGSFTPAAANPRLAAALSRAMPSGGAFRFTPSGAPGARRDVTVAVRARATTPAEAERTVSIASAGAATPTSVTPSAYNLGVAVGWKRFAISGDVAKVDTGLLPGGHESADVAVSYGGSKWNTRLQLGAERASSDTPRLIGPERGYSVDLGGSYSLTRNLDVTGGVRYRVQRDRLEPLVDDRRDSQAVYIGTAFRF